MRRLVQFLAVLALAGCASDAVSPSSSAPHPARNVVVSLTVPGQCLVGGCDPPSADFHTLGLIRIVNTGTSTVFLQPCGTVPLILIQHFINGQWFTQPINFACVAPLDAISLAPGDSIRMNQFFASGPVRVGVTVGTDANLSGELLSTSNGVVVP